MRLVILFSLTFVLFGCGTSREKWVGQHCTSEGGYSMGQNDAKHHRRTGLRALKQKCPPSEMKVAVSGYEKGFKAAGGKKSQKHEYGQDMLSDLVNVMDEESRGAEDKKQSESDSSAE